MKKFLSLLLVACFALSAIAGCANNVAEQTTQPDATDAGTAPQETALPGETAEAVEEKHVGGTLHLALDEDIDTINPHAERSSTDAQVIWSIGGVLYRIVPGADTAYEIVAEYADGEPVMSDADGLVWLLKVRSDAKWADGSAMTAADFVYSIKMYYDPLLLNAPGTTLDEYGIYIVNATGYMTQLADGAEVPWEDVGVKLIDDTTFELTLEKAASASQVKLAMSSCVMVPVKEELYEAGMNSDRTETDYGSAFDKFVSSGPFMLTGWTKDTAISMERNPYYPLADDILLDGMDYRIVPESGTQMQLFESGEIDAVNLTEADMETYGEDPRVMEVPGGGVLCIGLNMINTENPILQNQKFRQALFFGTNRAEAAMLGSDIPADYFITDSYIVDIETGLTFRETDAAKSYVDLENYSYDPEKAKTLFEEALAEAGQTSATLEILYQDTSESRKKVCEYLQSSWQNLFGKDKFTVTLQAVPSSQLSSQYRSHVDDPNAFEAGVIQSTYNFLDASSALMEWNANATRKKMPYYDEEFTAVYDEILALPIDQVEARTAKIAEAEAIMLDDVPFIPVAVSVSDMLVSGRVSLPYTTYNSILRFAWPWAGINE